MQEKTGALTFEQKLKVCDSMPGGKGYEYTTDDAKVSCYQEILPHKSSGETLGDIGMGVFVGFSLIAVGIFLFWAIKATWNA